MIGIIDPVTGVIYSAGNVYLSKTQSPIEAMLCFGLYNELGYRRGVGVYRDARCPQLRAEANNCPSAWVFAQHPIDRFFADFLIVAIPTLGGPKLLVVECDGHDFHTRPEQLARDQRRDAIIHECGYPIARFTGSEINNNISSVLRRIVDRLDPVGEEVCLATGRWPQTKRLEHQAETTLRDHEAGKLVDRLGSHETAEAHLAELRKGRIELGLEGSE